MTQGLLIDRLADAAWPAAKQLPLGPWKLRATQGVTRRANSAFTAGDQRLSDYDVESLIEKTETFYTAHDLPACFHISRYTIPPDLDDLLAARGYQVSGKSEIWIAPVTPQPKLDSPPDLVIHQSASPDETWFDCAFEEPPDRRRVHEQIVHNVPHPRLFVSALVDGRTLAAAMAVSAAAHTGVFAMTTLPQHRRQRLASRLLATIRAWAASRNDQTLYLQVMTENTPAKSLYTRAGFQFSHHYHYRIR